MLKQILSASVIKIIILLEKALSHRFMHIIQVNSNLIIKPKQIPHVH